MTEEKVNCCPGPALSPNWTHMVLVPEHQVINTWCLLIKTNKLQMYYCLHSHIVHFHHHVLVFLTQWELNDWRVCASCTPLCWLNCVAPRAAAVTCAVADMFSQMKHHCNWSYKMFVQNFLLPPKLFNFLTKVHSVSQYQNQSGRTCFNKRNYFLMNTNIL